MEQSFVFFIFFFKCFSFLLFNLRLTFHNNNAWHIRHALRYLYTLHIECIETINIAQTICRYYYVYRNWMQAERNTEPIDLNDYVKKILFNYIRYCCSCAHIDSRPNSKGEKKKRKRDLQNDCEINFHLCFFVFRAQQQCARCLLPTTTHTKCYSIAPRSLIKYTFKISITFWSEWIGVWIERSKKKYIHNNNGIVTVSYLFSVFPSFHRSIVSYLRISVSRSFLFYGFSICYYRK